MIPDEIYVRARWERVEYRALPQIRTQIEGLFGYAVVLPAHLLEGVPLQTTPAEAWSAARAFTEERLESIRQVEEEINLLRSMIILLSTEPGDMTAPIYQRTINRLLAALDDLRRGMKVEATK